MNVEDEDLHSIFSRTGQGVEGVVVEIKLVGMEWIKEEMTGSQVDVQNDHH